MFHRCKTLAEADKLMDALRSKLGCETGILRTLLEECYLDFKAFGNPERFPTRPQEAIQNAPGSTIAPSHQSKVIKGDERLAVLARINSAAPPGFDRSFVDSVTGYLERTGFITERQYNALLSTETRLKEKIGNT